MRNKLVRVEIVRKLIARAQSWQKSSFWHLAHEIEEKNDLSFCKEEEAIRKVMSENEKRRL